MNMIIDSLIKKLYDIYINVIVLKLLFVATLEMVEIKTWYNYITDIPLIIHKTAKVIYKGEEACLFPQYTLTVFEVCVFT
jgi:hypothetical protein